MINFETPMGNYGLIFNEDNKVIGSYDGMEKPNQTLRIKYCKSAKIEEREEIKGYFSRRCSQIGKPFKIERRDYEQYQ